MKTPIHPYWGIAEIISFSALFFTGLWFAGPFMGTSLLLQLAFWILFLFGSFYILWYSPKKLHHFRFSDIGFILPWKHSNFKKSLKEDWFLYFIFTFAGGVGLILYVLFVTPQSFSQLNWNAVAIKFFGYLIYGSIQAIIFFGFMMPRIYRALSSFENTLHQQRISSIVILTTALVFSLFHTPNFTLMGITFITGVGWAWIYCYHPNILLLGVSHAILGTILHQVVKLHMRIGPFYNNPDTYVIREIVPGLKKLIGNLF